MYTYKLATNGVIRSDGVNLPNDPNNTDYANYLIWALNPSNVPEPVYVIPYKQVFNTYMDFIRNVREALLNRLAGIGFAAIVSGDTITVNGVVSARASLLGITKNANVLSATDAISLKTAVIAAYQAMVAAAPATVVTAFQGFSL